MNGVNVEVTIDLDDKRRIWVSAAAEMCTTMEAKEMTEAVAETALLTFQRAGGSPPPAPVSGARSVDLRGMGQVEKIERIE